MKRFEITKKIYSSKALLKRAGRGGDASPTSLPGPALPQVVNFEYSVAYKSLFRHRHLLILCSYFAPDGIRFDY